MSPRHPSAAPAEPPEEIPPAGAPGATLLTSRAAQTPKQSATCGHIVFSELYLEGEPKTLSQKPINMMSNYIPQYPEVLDYQEF
ncbi:hypothetical protein GDO81_021686 [Engystomops pustulosus]|uniref:Uncharacterized protein n=1 Tax=Engystomops pustulosus TaxID=76066 RepID=A0AAV6YPU6_ENGPU|nr:hypothetical protein GDO81_021686 [Engystomops pustulosus]